ncbi:Tat pathway signal sequence domain protein [Aeromicrobium marinum DSM 15272]|uniref:Tat pathway signal sequence domain protein n=1 Tax=Aeromicrobium marinum DSM 15272 TaxID=585531 RepID=E2S914_9ACTN|nr:nucleotide pyrophosphatase/phosphodiesterase family protein [Aeromicrobium marinum]EFQ84284.1 Tat pathway signal sequence domain protein [Aeromicrobium marinum DSM 15272]
MSGVGGLGRRTFIRAAAAGGGAVVISGASGAPWANALLGPIGAKKRVYVLVIDGARPDEIGFGGYMPRLQELKTSGRWFPNARALPILETIPNHTMMMTGVRPDRTGVPANEIYDPALGEVREMNRPEDLVFPTVIERLNQAGKKTGTVLSKDYLFEIFGTRATYRWEPFPLLPITNHALDVFTMSALRTMVLTADPDMVFCNLGDIDRLGHADLTGTSLQLTRKLALASTDAQIWSFVNWLKLLGRWKDTTLVVLADHSMDWSDLNKVVTLNGAFKGNPLLDGQFAFADNGGADLLTYIGPASGKAASMTEARRVALETTGVLSVHLPEELRLGPNVGDLVVFCKAGWRFSDPSLIDNPIPGNHGHPATSPIPFFIAGGKISPAVLSAPATTMDVAPTVGQVFGLGAPPGGYDGVSRL